MTSHVELFRRQVCVIGRNSLSRLRRGNVIVVACLAVIVAALPASATEPRLDGEDCEQLRADQAKFLATGILDDIERGPQVAQKTLSAQRLRDIEFFIRLEEQIKFGCRIYPLLNEVVSDEELARRDAAEGIALPIRRDVHFGTARRSDIIVPEPRPEMPAAAADAALKGTVPPPGVSSRSPGPDLPPWTTMGRRTLGIDGNTPPPPGSAP